MSNATLAILTNDEIIALNQNYAGNGGDVLANGTGLDTGIAVADDTVLWRIWAKPLPDNEVGVVLFNEASTEPVNITLQFESLIWDSALDEGGTVDRRPTDGTAFIVRDLVSHEDIGSFVDNFTALNVPLHASMTLRLSPVSDLAISLSAVTPLGRVYK